MVALAAEFLYVGGLSRARHSRLRIRLRRRIRRRMARMQVYLPDAMYKQVKAQNLPVSELLQRAIEAELRRQELAKETDRYLAELIAEVGEPSAKERARIQAAVRRVTRAHARKAG